MTTNEKTLQTIANMINAADMTYKAMTLEEASEKGKYIATTVKGRPLPYQFDRRVREYDRASKSFTVKASYGFTVYQTKEKDCLRVVCIGVTMYARPDHNGLISLSYKAPDVKGYEDDDVATRTGMKDSDFTYAKSYLLKKYNFATMKFETLNSMFLSGMRMLYATAMKAYIANMEKAC